MKLILCAAMMAWFLAMASATDNGSMLQTKAVDQADPAAAAAAASTAESDMEMRSQQPEEGNFTDQDKRFHFYNDVAANGRFYKNDFTAKASGSGSYGGSSSYGGYGGNSGYSGSSGYGGNSGYGGYGGGNYNSYDDDDDDDDSSYRPKYRPQYQPQPQPQLFQQYQPLPYQQNQPPKQSSGQLGIHPCQLVSALGMIRNRAMAPLRPKNDRKETRKPCTTYDLERVVDMLNVLMVTVAKSSHCGLQALNLVGGAMDPFGYGSQTVSYRQPFEQQS